MKLLVDKMMVGYALTMVLATDWDISFRDNEGDEIAPTNGNEYHNLAKGNYFVTITGSNGCLIHTNCL
jgi:hypothetical protein